MGLSYMALRYDFGTCSVSDVKALLRYLAEG